MNLAFYKPNSKNTGCAFSFQLSTKGAPTVYVNGIQQFSWNEQTKNGSFSGNKENPEKNIVIKINENEIGGLIHAIRTYSEWKAFHSFEENKTQISWTRYKKKDNSDAFSFSVSRNGNQKFGMGVELAEAEALRVFLESCLVKIFEVKAQAKPQE
jgi:hypothetical protein